MPAPYRYTQDVYSLVGKADHLSLAMSIEAALNGRFALNFPSGL